MNRNLLLLVFLVVSDCSPLPFQMFLRFFEGNSRFHGSMSAGLGLEASEVCLVSEGASYSEHLPSSVQEMERLCCQ